MKKSIMLRSISILVAVCLILLQVPLAMASSMEITPLEDSEYLKEYYLPDADVSILLPLDAQLEVLTDTMGQYGLGIGIPKFPEAYFAFFALQNQDFQGMKMEDLDEAGIRSLLDTISSRAATLTYTIEDGLLPGIRLLRVPEPVDGIYYEHLVALYDGWVLNAMYQHMDTTLVTPEEVIRQQEDLMHSALIKNDFTMRQQSYTLPETDIKLTVPDTIYLRLANQTENFFEIIAAPAKLGIQVSAVHVYAVKDDAYLGHTVKTLPKDLLQQAQMMPTIEGADLNTSTVIHEDFANGQPVAAYESSNSIKHLLAIKDGWALYSTVMQLPQSIDPAWAYALQGQLMHQLLGGNLPVADWVPGLGTRQEGNSLLFPLQSSTLSIRIPDGFGVDIIRDNSDRRDIFLYALDGTPAYYHIASIASPVITGNIAFDDMYTEQELQQLCQSATEAIAGMGLTPKSVITPQGPQGVAAIHSTTQENVYEEYFWHMDSNSMSFSFTSENGMITKQDSETLLSIINQ